MEFLEYLKECQIGLYCQAEDFYTRPLVPDIDKLVLKMFDIDSKLLEKEKRTILEILSKEIENG